MKKVVTIGGGTGQYTLLRGLKKYDIKLSAIVSMIDNGGNTGQLRVEFGTLPPGDLRNCLLALSDEAELKEIMRLFEYRFSGKNNGNLFNYSLGNMILTALTDIEGDIAKGVRACSKILRLKGDIFPVSLDNSHVYGETLDGRDLFGQVNVSYPQKNEKIKKVWLEPDAFIYSDTAKAIREADLIVLCPGDLYGSLIPNFLVKGFKEALQESHAKIVYVCNLVTKQGSYEFKASDFLAEVQKYLGKNVDYVICNTKKPTQNIVDKYLEEDSFFVDPDLEGDSIIKEDLLLELEINNKITARHDSEKITRIIMGLL
ncbi:MAG TPA: uridine diphosphate-N-acetylglucosamine-binding protein YvcK [Candidatus Nanoarchaeia archaeon]|nr:uridine diphosphate-N-acetylglucosamine-binding protein YvcK [Candidatus Nanoarchaeia archaeon]